MPRTTTPTHFRVRLDKLSLRTKQASDDLVIAMLKLYYEFDGEPDSLQFDVGRKKALRFVPLPTVELTARFTGKLDPNRDTRSRATNTLNRTGLGWFLVWEA